MAALLLWLPCLLYETNFHSCFQWKYFVLQIIGSVYGDTTTVSNIITRALYLFIHRPVWSIMCTLIKHPNGEKQVPRNSIPSTMVKSLCFRIKDVNLKSYFLLLVAWFWTSCNPSLAAKCENGIRVTPTQAAFKH